jgi:hypothetical protein
MLINSFQIKVSMIHYFDLGSFQRRPDLGLPLGMLFIISAPHGNGLISGAGGFEVTIPNNLNTGLM